MFFDAYGTRIDVHEPKERPRYEPVNWDALGDNERRVRIVRSSEKIKVMEILFADI